ncbi:MAG: terminase small subunit [Bacteroidota bacterium]
MNNKTSGKKKNKDKPVLTPKMKAFCREYMVDRNMTKAAIRSGYSSHTAGVQGFDLFNHPLIQKEIDKMEMEAAKRNDISVDYVLQNIKMVNDRCLELAPIRDPLTGNVILVKEERTGQVAMICKFNPAAVLQANKLMGDHLKMWDGKTTDKDVVVNIHED